MGVKNVIGGTFEDIGEAVVKPVIAEVGHMIETGFQTKNPGPQLDPADTKRKEDETKKKLAEWRWRLDQQTKLAEAQRRVREEAKMKQLQQNQLQHQEKQVKQLEVVKKKEDFALKQVQRKTEIRGGVGG